MKIDFSHCNKCRVCGSVRFETLLNFSNMPLLAEPIKPQTTVPTGPLTVQLCNNCGYVFLKEVIDCSIYNDYIYTPQTSEDVVEYLRNFVLNTIAELDLKTGQCGLEIGSGDGSLCREFNNAGISFIGVEPSKTLSKISQDQNKIETYNIFMSVEFSKGFSRKFDLVIARHVLEHISDFASFFAAIDICLKPEGILVVEVPYLGDIVSQRQFYAFFFEHLSYFDVTSLANLLKRFGFFINRPKFVYPEGGSVLVHATRKCAPSQQERADFGNGSLVQLKNSFTSFLQKFENLIKENGPIAAYGAGQRGITLLNLLGASNANVIAIFDENPVYHGLLTPQSGIPVRSPLEMTRERVKGRVLILASSYDKQIRKKYKHMMDRFLSLSELV